MERQHDFYPAWDERMRSLRSRLRSVDAGAVGLTAWKWEQVRECVLTVASFCFEQRSGRCQVSVKRLLDTAGKWTSTLRTRDQWYGARREAERLGLIQSRRDHAAGRGRRDDWLSIDERAVDELVGRARAGPQPGSTRSNQVQLGPTRSNYAPISNRSPKGTGGPNNPTEKSSSSLPLRSTTDTRARATSPNSRSAALEPDWAKAEAEVFNFCSQAEVAIAAMRVHGATPADVVELAAYVKARPGAWRSAGGALYWRMLRWRPGQEAGEHGPPAAASWVEPAVAARRREFEVARLQTLTAEAERDQELERRYGPAVDRLTEGEVRELLEGDPFVRARWIRQGVTPTVRAFLIGRLSRQEANT
jgi:hypothetical protein